MVKIMEALREEHRNLTKLLVILEGQIAIFGEGGKPNYELLDKILDYMLNYSDLFHHPKEDLIFEKLRIRNPVATEAVGELEEEHNRLAELTKLFATAVSNIISEVQVPRENVLNVAREYVDSMRRHIEMEEQKFFPAAMENLTEADWAEIHAADDQPADPLFGPDTEESFESLREEIMALAEDET